MRIFTLLTLLIAMAVTCQAATYVIHPDGSGDFPTIQDALDSAHTGDVIELSDGTFTGNGNCYLYVDNVDITLRSQSDDPELCIIDCQGSPASPSWGIIWDGTSSASLMRGITVKNAWDTWSGGGITCDNSEPAIEYCILLNNYAEDAGGGIYCTGGGYSPMIYQCQIAANQVGQYGRGGGIAVDDECEPFIDYCIFSGNGAEDAGLHAGGYSTVTVRFCTFYSNHRYGITTYQGAHVEISNTIIYGSASRAVNCDQGDPGTVGLSCCDVYGNGNDYYDCIAAFEGVSGNISLDPLFCPIGEAPLHLAENSPCAPYSEPNTGCNQIGARPVGCGPYVYAVSAAGTGDFATIQAAIDGAWPGSVIELADGTYTGTGNRDLVWDGKPLVIESASGDPTACVIHCQGSPTLPHWGIEISGVGLESRLEGITIQNAYVVDEEGAGIRCTSSASPSIHNCRILNNECEGNSVDGAGLLVGGSSAPVVTDCLFHGNRASFGGAVKSQSIAGGEFLRCSFTSNYATATTSAGGAVSLESAPTLFEDCFFDDNHAQSGGAMISLNGRPTLTRCDFQGSDAYSGGALYFYGAYGVEIADCTFYGNMADEGSALYLWNANMTFSGCSFGGHGHDYSQGTIRCFATGLDLSNCTFIENEGGDGAVFYFHGSWAEVDSCTFVGNSGSSGAVAHLTDDYNTVNFSNCILASNLESELVYCGGGASVIFDCSDLWDNEFGDWVGCLAGQGGVDGNISMDPLFCGEANPEEPYTLRSDSPCLEENNPGACGRMGAWPVGCEGGTAVGDPWLASGLYLSRPAPNPTRDFSRLHFALPADAVSGEAHLGVYDVAGRLVKVLVHGRVEPGLYREVVWDGRDQRGRPVASGIYFVKLHAARDQRTEKVILLR